MVVGLISDSPLPYCVSASVWGEIDRTFVTSAFQLWSGNLQLVH